MSMMVSFVLSFFPRDVLDEILNLIESVSEDFPSYSYFINYYHFFSYILCHSYTGGNHEGATAIVASIVTILIL